MNIADLKKKIASLPDEMEVVGYGSDHMFLKIARSAVVKAEVLSRGLLGEYWDEQSKSNPSNKVIEVFWID